MIDRDQGRAAPSMAGRATAAVLLTAGFYGLALLIAVGLLAIPYFEWTLAHRVTGRLAVICVLGAGIILWSIVPRPGHFVPPGPRLDRADNPRLFAEVERVAKQVDEPMPSEVYLVADVNAGVFQRGGFLGRAGRRVMLVGLSLLDVLTVSEFRAVLAHEFGHYHGGDVKLGPWIYRTREAIGRTIRNLTGRGLLQMPFLFYGRLFLRTTQAISRQQEFAADALAARTVGSVPLVQGLRRIHAAGLAFSAYWREEFVPVINAGFEVPLVAGFQQFSSNDRVSALVGKAIQQELANPTVDPFDSHPPLAERIAAVEHLPAGPPPDDQSPALGLLGDPRAAEHALLLSVLKPGVALRELDWARVATEVILPQMRKRVETYGKLLSGATVAQLPELAERAAGLGRDIVTLQGRNLPPDADTTPWGIALLADSLTVALASNGWTIEAPPGALVSVRRNSDLIEPHATVESLAGKEADAEGWRRRVETLGIAQAPLGGPALLGS